jgi:crossover junction endodeoxyribonuclease RuvC
MLRVLGIDPGTARLGYAILDFDINNKSLLLINCGIIQTSKNDSDSTRLKIIRNDLIKLIEEFQPRVASVEKLFFFKNPKTIIPVAQARGVILETCETKGIQLFEYTPLEMKKIITGQGKAEKSLVSEIIHRELKLATKITPDDAVDAVGLAICVTRADAYKLLLT